MRKILLLLLVILSFQAFGQTPPGYQTRIVRERIQGSFMVDSTLHIPRYNGTPSGVRGGGSVQDGALAMDTTNHILYIYSGGIWRTVSGGTPTLQQVTTAGNRTTDDIHLYNGATDSLILQSTQLAVYNAFGGGSTMQPGYIVAQNAFGARWIAGNEVGMSNTGSGFNTSLKNINPSASNEFYLRETNTSSHIDTIANLSDVRAGGGGSGGFFNPNQTSTGNTAHDANYKSFAVTKMLSGHWKAGTGTNYMDEAYDSTYHAMVVQNGSDFYGWEANKSAGNKFMKLYARESSKDAVLTVKGDSIVLDQTDGDYRFKNVASGSNSDSVMVIDSTGRVNMRQGVIVNENGIHDQSMLKYDSSNVEYDVIKSDTLLQDLSFLIGDSGYPANGSTVITMPALKNRKVRFHISGILMTEGTHYTRTNDSTFTFVDDLETGTPVEIETIAYYITSTIDTTGISGSGGGGGGGCTLSYVSFNVTGDLTESPTGTWSSAAQTGKGYGTTSLQVGNDGDYQVTIVNSTNYQAPIGLDDDGNNTENYTDWECTLYANVGTYYYHENGGSGTSSGISYADGDLLRFHVVSGVIKGQKSSDGGTNWTDIHTFSGVTQDHILYPKVSLTPVASKKISEAKVCGFE